MKRLTPLWFLLFTVFSVTARVLSAQTCSCAGAPLLRSQSPGTLAKGNVVTGLTFESNQISNLYSGSEKIDDRNQRRRTETGLLELNVGLSDRLTLSGTITFIRKQRTTGLQHSGAGNSLTTTGIGDGLMMAKYEVIRQTLWNPYSAALGAGVKVPFGTTSLRRNGLALNADMQPGTGAWDGVGWLFISRTLRAQNITFYTQSSFRLTGTNERFSASDHYRFGNELVSAAGVSGPLFNGLSLTLNGIYRSVDSDRLNGEKLPNTGGKWITAKTTAAISLSEHLSLQVSGELPVYQYLNGTQPTTSFVVSVSLLFRLKNRETGFIRGVADP